MIVDSWVGSLDSRNNVCCIDDRRHLFVRLSEPVCKLKTLWNGGLFTSGGHNNTLCPSPVPESTGHWPLSCAMHTHTPATGSAERGSVCSHLAEEGAPLCDHFTSWECVWNCFLRHLNGSASDHWDDGTCYNDVISGNGLSVLSSCLLPLLGINNTSATWFFLQMWHFHHSFLMWSLKMVIERVSHEK